MGTTLLDIARRADKTGKWHAGTVDRAAFGNGRMDRCVIVHGTEATGSVRLQQGLTDDIVCVPADRASTIGFVLDADA